MAKHFYFITGLLILCFGFSCSEAKPSQISAKKKSKAGYALKPDDIYDNAAIDTALAHASSIQRTESRKLFMNGLDLLVNKNNPEASVDYFKEAIYYCPDVKNYEHLFTAYLRSGNAALADSVNSVFYERIGYALATFNAALIAAVSKDTIACVGLLEDATNGGFAFKERITNEPLFEFLKDNRSYQGFLLAKYGNDELMRKHLFASFISSFPDLPLPFKMPIDSSASFNYDLFINYDFSDFIPGMNEGRFSRDVTKGYAAVGKFKLNNGIALLYKTSDVIADTLNPVHTNLLIYDTIGNLLSETPLACFCSPLESKDLFIDKDFNIEVKRYTSTWAFDPLEKGYAGNSVVSRNPTATFGYFILEGNKIEARKEPDQVASSGQ